MLLSLTVGALAMGSLFQETRPPADSLADTLRAARLGVLEVTVTRSRDVLARLPASVAVVGREAVRTAQPTLGLDEALTLVPGVYVANRWNFSLDQRLSIRGFGSRANFGIRGVKVLLDGVPQTLPDGQSQLTNVEFAALERVEVLRGASSALYGNASGGAVALFTEAMPRDIPAQVSARFEAGSFGTTKWLARAGGRRGIASASLGVSRLLSDGFREHSATDQRQVWTSITLEPGEGTRIQARWSLGDAPRAENPGALTPTEVALDPSQAAATNVARGADKKVRQHQASVSVRHRTETAWELEAALFGIWRDLENPLATPPPGPPSPTAGTFNAIDRLAGGFRAQATVPLGDGAGRAPARLIVGLDLQRLDDERLNQRSESGEPTDSVLAHQRELTTEIGPFAQLHWDLLPRVGIHAGLRHDRVSFDVRDRHLTDGQDNSGRRTTAEWSGNFGMNVALSERVSAHAAVATAFETPTSTELVTTAGGGVGFNADLGPQRATAIEAGVRGTGSWWSLHAVAFANRVRDAIVQARELNGRAFFANAARMRNDGFEVGAVAAPHPLVSLTAAYTYARYRFAEYRLQNGAAVDTLDGKRLAGVPRHFLRASLRLEPVTRLTLFVDQVLSSSLFADDANTLDVGGWGAGVTHLRAAWEVQAGQTRLTPFLAVQNLFDRRFVGSVTINGFGGRVLEPSPGRYLFAGAEVEWRARQ